ncbi:MAG TPA: transcription termination factor Rho [Rhodothermales bacterium]|nr:transcription termination factor Rho [Rhodothermales bacterium]
MEEQYFTGLLELIGDKKFGFVRTLRHDLPKGELDPFVPPPMIKRFHLRDGVTIEGTAVPGKKGDMVIKTVEKVMGIPVDRWVKIPLDVNEPTIHPNEKWNLVTNAKDIPMRMIDIVAPIGKGQRAMVVSPPRSGKTMILHGIARGIHQNHPQAALVALLVDERPEEVTDFKRNIPAMVFASSNDREEDNHVRVSTLALEYCLRLVEMRRDVVFLIDSLTRLGRTFNLFNAGSGRTLSGGLDSRALNIPRRIFGAAKKLERGGSLTIIATALTDTGSRMDEVILEEFKGTGNCEIVLDREMANKRIFPAINVRRSGTRNEDQLLGDLTYRQHTLMRVLNMRHPIEAGQALIKRINQTTSNEELLHDIAPTR